MAPGASRDRVVLLGIGILLLFAPLLLILLTLGALVLTAGLALGQITPLEFLELYLLDLVLFVGFAYVIYRLTLWLSTDRVPVLLDALERDEAGDGGRGESGGDRE